MATASDFVFGLQVEMAHCLEVVDSGDVYTDNSKYAAPANDRIKVGGFIHTYGIPALPFGVSQRSSIASINLINTEQAPLDSEIASSFKGREYKLSFCGILNYGLFNQEVVSYADRVDYAQGVFEGSNGSQNSFSLVLGTGEKVYSQEILEELPRDGSLISATGFAFTNTSTTNARDSGVIQTDVSPASLTSDSQTISISFDTTVDDFEVVLKPASRGAPLTEFLYADVSSTKVSSTGVEIESDIEISGTSGTSTTVTLTFPPASEMKWIIRDIDSESIGSWSVEPDNLSEAVFGNAINTELIWTGLGGETEITFVLSGLSGTYDISVPPDDSQTRPHIFGTGVSVKVWPVYIQESIPMPTSLGWSVSPDTTPSGQQGAYIWEDASLTGVNLTGTFTGVSGSAPLVLTSSDNEVTLSNGKRGITFAFQKVYEKPSSDADKTAYIPLVLGSPVLNYSPLLKGNLSYSSGGSPYELPQFKLGSENVRSVRNNGTNVPVAADVPTLSSNHDSNIVSYYQRTVDESLMLVSGPIETSDITVTGFSDELYLNGVVRELGAIVGLSGSDILVANDIKILPAAWYISAQTTFKQALDTILSPMDVVHYIRRNQLYVERRKTFSMDDFDLELDYSGISDFKFGNEGERYHKLTVFYRKNWTPQPDVTNYKNEWEYVEQEINSVKYSDYPTNTVRSGSIARETYVAFTSAAGANLVLESLDRDKRVNFPVSFYYENRKGEIIPNDRILLPSELMGGKWANGMFLPTSVQINTDKKTQFVKGTWYAN